MNPKFAILLLPVILILSGCGSTSQAPKKAEQQVFVSQCGYSYEQRPTDVTLTCADAGMRVSKLKWTSWTSTSAEGTGVMTTNTCDPDCASGNYETQVITILLNTPTKDSKSKTIFTTAILESNKPLPNGLSKESFDITTPADSLSSDSAAGANTDQTGMDGADGGSAPAGCTYVLLAIQSYDLRLYRSPTKAAADLYRKNMAKAAGYFRQAVTETGDSFFGEMAITANQMANGYTGRAADGSYPLLDYCGA